MVSVAYPASSYLMGRGALFLGLKRREREADNSSLSSAAVKIREAVSPVLFVFSCRGT
jgi:hypothetical protein